MLYPEQGCGVSQEYTSMHIHTPKTISSLLTIKLRMQSKHEDRFPLKSLSALYPPKKDYTWCSEFSVVLSLTGNDYYLNQDIKEGFPHKR